MVKNLPVVQETWVQSLGQEDPLEKEKTTNLVFLPGQFPWIEVTGRLQSVGLQGVGHDLVTKSPPRSFPIPVHSLYPENTF